MTREFPTSHLAENYQNKFGKPIPNNKKSEVDWVIKQLQTENGAAEPVVEITPKQELKPVALIKDSGWSIVFAPIRPECKTDIRRQIPWIVVGPGQTYQNVRNYDKQQCFFSKQLAEQFILSQI